MSEPSTPAAGTSSALVLAEVLEAVMDGDRTILTVAVPHHFRVSRWLMVAHMVDTGKPCGSDGCVEQATHWVVDPHDGAFYLACQRHADAVTRSRQPWSAVALVPAEGQQVVRGAGRSDQ